MNNKMFCLEVLVKSFDSICCLDYMSDPVIQQ